MNSTDDSLLVLDLGLYIVDGVGRLNLEGDGLAVGRRVAVSISTVLVHASISPLPRRRVLVHE